MANEDHLRRLKQGVDVWNAWRDENRFNAPDLTGANLSGANLHRAWLWSARLDCADLSGADLSEAGLSKANLEGANLREADLHEASLYGAVLIEANLSRANLSGADLFMARLGRAILSNTVLSNADFKRTVFQGTILADVDLSTVKNLKSTIHWGPSSIGIDTIHRSGGKVHEKFLRGCGAPETMITYITSLVANPIQFYSAFISYSGKDEEFVKRLYADLRSKGVRVWFAPEDLKIGDKFRTRIDEAVLDYDKLMLVLSENSINSTWVEKEVEAASEKERQQGRTVLFPIRLDEAVMNTTQAWAADIRRTRHIGDFCRWKENDEYQKAISRLLRDLTADETKT